MKSKRFVYIFFRVINCLFTFYLFFQSKNKENTDGESAEDSTEDTDMSDTENSAMAKLSAMKKLPDVKLSNKLLNLLEDLLLEGDLLETNMDECHQIWKLLQVKKKFEFRKPHLIIKNWTSVGQVLPEFYN